MTVSPLLTEKIKSHFPIRTGALRASVEIKQLDLDMKAGVVRMELGMLWYGLHFVSEDRIEIKSFG